MVDGHSNNRRTSESSNLSYTNHPSFSSSLLDEIYRSIDQGEEEILIYRETMRKKQRKNSASNVRALFETEEEIANFQRACMIEKWMEKKVCEKIVVRIKSNSAGELPVKKSSNDFFASQKAESFKGKRPKPIRVGDLSVEKEKLGRHEKPVKNQDGFLNTKSRALKFYGDLKKAKQPISPGARLAGFLNSLLAGAGYPKKPKMNSPGNTSPILKSANTSTCSSASSFSRSCLSKTPSSRGKPTEKRSVRFSPVSVIVDEDCQPCGHKSLLEEKQSLEAINEEIRVIAMEKNRRVEEASRGLLRNYQNILDREFGLDFANSPIKNQAYNQELDDDDDDAASYASSDLFELDNLSAIGIDRYREELPVYETTHLRTNRAIANGLIL